MRVGELTKLLREFPPELPVFFCPQSDDHVAIAPQDAVLNLVTGVQQKAMGFKVSGIESGDHEDAVVIYAINVRAME